MSTKISSILLLLSTLSILASAKPTSFIESSCKTTTYPTLCIQSLSSFASKIQQSPRELAQTALLVSLSKAQSTQTFVTKLRNLKGMKAREYSALKDCLEEVSDTVDRLSKSIKELKGCGENDKKSAKFLWHISNVETWVSAAITDENTCVDGFAGKSLDGKVKGLIRAKILNVAHVTSNALALINKFASEN